MRLRGCVAIELFVGALVAAAVSGAALWGVAELRGAVASEGAALPDPAGSEGDLGLAASATRSPDGTRLVSASISGEVLPGAPIEGEAEPEPAWSGQFLGQSDQVLMAPLRDSPVRAIKLNRGGSSLSLRIDFESGGRAACKPNQIHLHSQPRRELAAYRINRLLGLSSVPPAIGRRFLLTEIADHFKAEASRERARFLAEATPESVESGTVLGELTWWVPVLDPAMIEGFEIDTTEGVVTWKRYLTVGQEIPPASLPIVAQISALLLFDFIINNSDRWSGGNIKSSQGQSVLVFIDNTLSFGGDPNGHNRVRTYLYRSQRFSRGLVDRLRRLTDEDVQEAVTRDIDPFPLLLEKNEIRAVTRRRDFALRYIDELIATHGEDAVLAFP